MQRMVTVKLKRQRVDRRTVIGRRIKTLYQTHGADACLDAAADFGVTRRAMLLTLAAFELNNSILYTEGPDVRPQNRAAN